MMISVRIISLYSLLFCLNTDVFLMQIDRFLAVYWNLKYKSRVTAKMAIRSCLASKVFAIIVTVSVASLDQPYGKCSSRFEMLSLKKTNIYLDAYPKLLVACVLLIVSIYVGVTMTKLENKINPLVSLPNLTSLLFRNSNQEIVYRRNSFMKLILNLNQEKVNSQMAQKIM